MQKKFDKNTNDISININHIDIDILGILFWYIL